jgi:methylenetetrahydrofolate reductase (NADPH)
MNISFEFFPPRSENAQVNLFDFISELETINPEYFSITFGAGGTTQDATINTVNKILTTVKTPAVPHLSCIGSDRDNISGLLKQYQQMGVQKIVALRGDIPSGMRDIGDFHYAYDLVKFIRENFNNDFQISVAAYPEKHPQAKNYDDDVQHLIQKLQLADNAITQYFYNIDAFLHLRDEVAKHTDKPLIPGIMPITNFESVVRFSQMCGAEIPKWIYEKLAGFKNNEDLIKFGFEVVNNLCQNLKKEGVRDFHFYSMNKVYPSLDLAKNLL